MPPESSTSIAPHAILLHVGPHKTGTTTVQGALHHAREALAEHRVHYPGAGRQPREAARAVTDSPGIRGEAPVGPEDWQRLIDDVAAHAEERVAISSEIFADADPQAITRIAEGLGHDRLHVAVTLRPLTRILPSQWQQLVQNRRSTPYDEWLHCLFEEPESATARVFWRRHAHSELVNRWSDEVGARRVTVIVSDPSDHLMVLRAFEAMLELPTGTLRPGSVTNRSLTLGEVELVRLINDEAARRDWSDERYATAVRWDVAKQLRTPPPAPGEALITTPGWAVAAAAERQAAAVQAISASGVNVIGDLTSLHSDEPAPGNDTGQPDALAAAVDLLASLASTRVRIASTAYAAEVRREALASTDTMTLLGAAVGRARRRMLGRRDR